MSYTFFRPSMAVLLIALVHISFPFASHAQKAPDTFPHKEITLLIPSAVGGGYDRYGRLLARHLGKHLPGKPSIVPKGMPGAGGLVLANFMYGRAPRDGSVIAGMQNERIYDPILGVPNSNYRSSELIWIGSINQTTNVCASWHATGVTSAAQLRTRELVVGVAGNTSTESVSHLLAQVVGSKFKMVLGYPGTNEIQLAIERGEVEGACGLGWDSLISGKPDWIADKKVNIFAQIGAEPLAELNGAPFIYDLLLKQDDRPLVDFLVGRMYLGRPFVGPPGMPVSMTQSLREAFDAAMKDPELISEAEKGQMPILPVSGDIAQKHVEKLEKTAPDVIERARNLL
jgi:tripartite-type tricarboxylate transporter receptor subunit TctC